MPMNRFDIDVLEIEILYYCFAQHDPERVRCIGQREKNYPTVLYEFSTVRML